MGYPFDHERQRDPTKLSGCAWTFIILVLILIAIAVIFAGICGAFS